MHEWALAQGVIHTALQVKERNKLKNVTMIKIQLGELQQISEEIFLLALNEIAKSEGISPKFDIELEQALFQYRRCGEKWDFKKDLLVGHDEQIHFIPELIRTFSKCPKCKSPDFEVASGRGVSIAFVKGDK